MAAKVLVLSLRSVWCHSNHVKVHANDATIIVRFASTRNSGTQILYQIWDFSIRLAGRFSIFQENESRAWSQLSVRRVVGKIRMLARSRNPCKLSLFRFHSSAWFLYFYTMSGMLRRLSSESFNRLQTPDVNKFFKSHNYGSWFFHYFLLHINCLRSLNTDSIPDWIIGLGAVVTVYISGWALCRALLFSLYLWMWIQPSLFAPHHSLANNCTWATVSKIDELNVSIVYRVVQFSFYAHDPQ